MATDVYIKSGEQGRSFAFTNPVNPVLISTVNQNSLPLYKESVFSTFQATVRGTGALTATIAIQVSNEDDTGRGFLQGGGLSGRGFAVTTVNGSPTLTSQGNQFYATMVGGTIACPGVPIGTTVTAVAANGVSLTMSANATATTTIVIQAAIYDNAWCATPMGTITLSGNTIVSDGFTSMAPWRYARAVITNLTGTGASVSVLMGV